MKDIKGYLFSLSEFDSEKYADLDLDRLAIYALNLLEEHRVPLYFDYVAVAIFRLFPKRFSMANFDMYPDTNRINKSLRRLTDSKRNNWARGNIENGFVLTDAGREMNRQVQGMLAVADKGGAKKSDDRRGRSAGSDISEVKQSGIFRKWQHSAPITDFEVFEFLGAPAYTPKPLLANHLEKLKDSSNSENDEEAIAFLEWLRNDYRHIFEEN